MLKSIRMRKLRKVAVDTFSIQFYPISSRLYNWTVEATYTKKALPLEKKQELYPEFVQASPWGLVPAIRHNGTTVCESLVTVEYIDEALKTGHALLPDSPAERSRVRVWTAHANERIIPHFYKLLMHSTSEERAADKNNLLKGLQQYAEAMHPEGPFFLGPQFSMADIALAPWFERFLSVGKTYRGLEIPNEGVLTRLHRWYTHLLQFEPFAKTIVSQERLVSNYSGYADNTATSAASHKYR
eukprot:m.126219 g.126219  ORF g.126219 m.126219 type:complete len:242 (-) comp15768_c0_seq8:325-1050(-)